jgi:starch synthase (maltosyl-transferring)
VEEISQLNRLRRAHPALQTHLNVEFFEADNEAVLYFGKQTPGARDLILAAISFDPHHPQSAQVVSPFWRLGAQEGDALLVEDLLTGARFVWRGRNQTVHLDPSRPYGLWRLEREAGS